MFSVVFRFSSPVSLIRLESFLPGSHFSLMIPRSAELTFKKRGNCNNVTFGAESSQSGSYITTIIYNFTLINLTSTTTPHLVGLSFGASVLSHPINLTTYALNFSLSMQWEGICGYANYLYFIHLLNNEVIIS